MRHRVLPLALDAGLAGSLILLWATGEVTLWLHLAYISVALYAFTKPDGFGTAIRATIVSVVGGLDLTRLHAQGLLPADDLLEIPLMSVLAYLFAGFALLRARAQQRVDADRLSVARQIDALPLATVVFDAEARIVTWNPAAERLFGWTAAEVVGRKNPTVTRDERSQSNALHKMIVEGGTLSGVEVHRTSRDGKAVELAMYSALLDREAGAAAGFLVLYDDITERKRAERERDAAQKQYRALVEQLPLVTYIDQVDDDATNIYTSPQVEDVLGWPMHEWQDDPRLFLQLLHPEDRERVLSHVKMTNATRDGFFDEYRLLHREGHYVWVRDHSTIVDDDDGKAYARGFLLDITEQKRLEEQLLQAQKMDALGQFAGGIAHDFNNLLTGIGGYADLAAMSVDDTSPARHCLDGIKSAATEAASLTARLLAFSRRHVPERRLVDMNELVEGAVDLLRRVLRADIEVRLELASDLPPVAGDPAQLKQVVLNLALNGRDAIEGPGTLTIATELHDDRVALRVHDDGCGMDEVTRTRALEPFFTTKPEGEGTGLGLAVVYGVVDALGGNLTIDSQPGDGTTVEVLLPAAEGEADTLLAAETPRISGRNERVLVVEDRDIVRALARDLLSAAGFDVSVANGAAQALMLPGPFDLLVSDVVMPGLSGPELAERLRREQPELPVVFMSGYTDDVLADEVLDLPRTWFLRKPFAAESLVAAVRDALDYAATDELTSAAR